MLTALSLERFKSWKRIDGMRLAPITALFDTNSSASPRELVDRTGTESCTRLKLRDQWV
jgi:hypothetical protein